MKTYRFLAVWALFLSIICVTSTSVVEGYETKKFRFKARTWDTMSSSTNQLQGEYDVTVSNGKCEVTHEIGEKSYSLEGGGGAAAELCRMVGIDSNARRYVNPPHKVGQQWSQSNSYRVSGVPNREFQRTVTYKVVSEKEISTPARTSKIFKIEGRFSGYSQRTGAFEQTWDYNYDETANVIVKWNFDSAVGQAGAKVEIELIFPNLDVER